MKHPFLLLLAIVVMATVALIIWGVISNHAEPGQYGLSNDQKEKAIRIALSTDPEGYYSNYTGPARVAGDVVRPLPGFYTYSNDSGLLAVVPVNYSASGDHADALVTVNLNTSKAVSVYVNDTSSGASSDQYLKAVDIAINDPETQDWLESGRANADSYHSGYIVKGVGPSGFDRYGYVNPYGVFIDVPMQFASSVSPANEYLLATVNLSNNKTIQAAS